MARVHRRQDRAAAPWLPLPRPPWRRGCVPGEPSCWPPNRASRRRVARGRAYDLPPHRSPRPGQTKQRLRPRASSRPRACARSEEHTSELQSLAYLVCRLLLEKKKKNIMHICPEKKKKKKKKK